MFNTLVVVGNADARWRAIAPGIPDSVRIDISGVQYCMLERIGRSRYNVSITHLYSGCSMNILLAALLSD